MVVIDASALVDALLGEQADPQLLARLEDAGELHAPHVLDVEVLHALGRLVRMEEIDDERALDVIDDLRIAPIERYAHDRLTERIWSLGGNVTAYDAAYVALAEALDLPLVTTDARLARAPGHDATIELYRPAR